MNSANNWFVHDHSQHGENLAGCRQAIKAGDWDKASSIFEEFVTQLKSHMRQEEEEIFPNYVALVKISHDPTQALRTEHDRINSFVKEMQHLIKTHDSKHGLECLHQLEQEINIHEEKEEKIFLPMAGYVLDTKFWETRRKPGTSGPIESGHK